MMSSEEKLNKLVTDVEVIKTKLEMLTKNYPCNVHTETMDDHESRIRVLEGFKNRFIGALMLGGALGGLVGGLFGFFAKMLMGMKNG